MGASDENKGAATAAAALRLRCGDSTWWLCPPREWRASGGGGGRAIEVWARGDAGTIEGYEYTRIGPFKRARRIRPPAPSCEG